METKTKKSVHFASQDSQHIISRSCDKPESRFITIEDETSNPSKLRISEKAMKLLPDCSKMRIDKQLTKLAKDGVIFMKAPSNNTAQINNALKLRTHIIKLLSKYEFVETIPHPKHDPNKSLQENNWIPEHAVKSTKNSLKALFVGSVGQNEPKWRSFWEWSDDEAPHEKEGNTNISTCCIAPESQSSYSLSPPEPVTVTAADDGKDVTFEQLSDEDKRTIYEWAANREGTMYFKERAMKLFQNYAQNDSTLNWEINIVDPLWFRVQSAGSMLHTDAAYIVNHTNLLNKISGQKLMISGIDITQKAIFIGKKSKILKQKLCNDDDDCALCSYTYKDGDDEQIQIQIQQEAEEDKHNILCESCCDSQFGIYTIWTALDYFESAFNSGSMVFALGSHTKYKGIHEGIACGEFVPSGFAKKSIADKEKNVRWGFVDDIQPGDQFIFNIKTLHASTKAMDGFLRARIDFRVTIKPNHKRFVKEIENVSTATQINASHLGLSQLCSQAVPLMKPLQKEESLETDHDDDDRKENETNDDDDDVDMNKSNDLSTQLEDSDDDAAREKRLTPLTQDVEQNIIETIPETQQNDNVKETASIENVETPQSARLAQANNEKKKVREIVPFTQQTNEANQANQAIPILEHERNERKRTFSNCNMDDNINLSQSSIYSPNKRQKVTVTNYHNLSFRMQDNKIRMSNIRHLSRLSDEEFSSRMSLMRNNNNKLMTQWQSQMNDTCDMMEIANERYLFAKQQYEQERERANHFQRKNENLQKKLIENHNLLFKMFEE